MSDRDDVRELAEEIAREVYGTSAAIGTADVITEGEFSRTILRWEDRIHAFLVDRAAEVIRAAKRQATAQEAVDHSLGGDDYPDLVIELAKAVRATSAAALQAAKEKS